ncbi:hypothetical protein LCGC14_0421060 [marine sediment metagenome]|uniref:Uncharacterized protein n=1 Tax=marine sediment metagenome TaxID=412755 RepID=A0A0F9SWX7_9ZZZZ
MTDEQIVEGTDLSPPETAETEMMRLEVEANPEVRLAMFEKLAELAPRFAQAQNTILAAMTYAGDWLEFSGMMCLKSAAAERIARLFPYKIEDGVVSRREEFTDAIGKGYRIVYEGYASCQGRRVWAMGCYSSREAFVARKGGEWKADEEINENNIRRAAYHYFIGNCLKSLFGLRAIPVEEWEKVMAKTGRPDAKTGKVPFKSGTKGGTSTDDSAKQAELCTACQTIVNAGFGVEHHEGKVKLMQLSDDDFEKVSTGKSIDIARKVCIGLSAFPDKKDKTKMVAGLSADQLKGKRLEISLATAKKLADKAVQDANT